MTHNELQHWGIRGMKWGIRRFQNKDGSLTKAGKQRYGDDSHETEEARKARIDEKKKAVISSRSAKELYDNADLFSTQELQNAYNRLQLERNIQNLVPADVEKGKKFVDKMVNWGETASKGLTTGTKLYNSFARIYNSKTEAGKEKPMELIRDNDTYYKTKGKKDSKKDKDKEDKD